MMELDRVYYCCEMCKGEIHVKVRDIGFYPKMNPCDKCEGMAILNFNPSHEYPNHILLNPNLYEWVEYMKAEEEKWMRKGFSKIEASYLLEHDANFLRKGGLVLIKI